MRPNMIISVATVLAAMLTLPALGAAPAAMAADTLAVSEGGVLRLTGRGNGHGVGMSQYGAKTGAERGADAAAILARYYPGAVLSDVPLAPLRVLLSLGDGDRADCASVPLAATPCFRLSAEPGLRFRAGGREIPVPADIAGTPVAHVAVGAEPDGLSLWALAGEQWQPLDGGAHFAGSVEVAGTEGRLSLIWPNGAVRQYAGDIRAVWASPTTVARVNVVDMEDYLRSVVPAEMPASWPVAAVQAQAVAARTFAHARRLAAGVRAWDICDTTACQVYRGTGAEHPEATAKMAASAPSDVRGKVLTVDGVPVNAMFSSSNGGHSVAGGPAYLPALPDDWDPAPAWVREVSIDCVQERNPGRGSLREVLLDRNGQGPDGGRVTRMRLGFANGTVEFTGANPQAADAAMRRSFTGCGAPGGLRSSWFSATIVSSPDSGIIRYWTAAGGASSLLGAVTSGEYAVPGGVAQDFAHGRVFWSAGTGARSLIGAIFARYTELGTTASPLGFLIGDERPARAGGAYSLFQHGKILWHANTGAHPVWGRVDDVYDRLGAEYGPLAYPVSGEESTNVAGVVRQRFEIGAIYWDSFHGARAVYGAIYQRYLLEGAEDGVLGDPVGGEYAVPGGRRSDFLHGALTWTAATGAVELTMG